MPRKKRPDKRAWGSGYSVFPNGRGGFVGSIQISAHPRRHKTKTFTGPQAEADAEAWCQEQVTLLRDRHIDLRRGAQLLTDFASTWYHEVASEKGLKKKTLENYRIRIQLYILPYLGDRRLDSIRPEDVQRWMNKLRADDLAQSTVRDLFNLLKQILKIARKWKYVPENPCDDVDAPRVKKIEKEPFGIDELTGILITAEHHRNAAAFWLAAILGTRLGETLGVRWQDVDWHKSELKIAQQVQGLSEEYETEAGERKTRHFVEIIDSAKTDAGARTVPLPPVLLERLRQHRTRQLEERLYLGPKWADHDLIFASEVGTPIGPRNFEATWYRVRSKAGVESGRNFHLFRHTAASLMGDLGVIDEVRAAIFGWSKRGMVAHYTHASESAKRKAVEAVERLLLDAVEKKRQEKAG